MVQRGTKIGCVTFGVVCLSLSACNQPTLNDADLDRAREFVLSSLSPVPADPSNAVADNPDAAKLGEQLFFDAALSSDTTISCATCHQPAKQFQDGIPTAFGLGPVARRTTPLAGAQWGEWFYWDGRKDSQWSQALEPLETPAEHGMTRDMVARHVLRQYPQEYEKLFGELPDTDDWPFFASPLVPGPAMENWRATDVGSREAINQVFSNIGKALAAFQRTIMPEENRFDRHVSALLAGNSVATEDALTEDEIAGFRLFVGKARCDNCHSGPLFTDHFFHNTGVPVANPDSPDYGRALAVLFLRDDIFACDGKYSDSAPEACRELRFMSDDPAVFEGAFKTPSLRGVATRPPYMHAGQIDDLEAVVRHYVARPDPFASLPEPDGTLNPHGPHTDAPAIELTEVEIRQLVAFLELL